MRRVLISWLAFAACVLAADDLSGHYVLHGVREVGSELLLKPDGTFGLQGRRLFGQRHMAAGSGFRRAEYLRQGGATVSTAA